MTRTNTEVGPRQARPSAADDPAATSDQSRPQRNAMEHVTGIEHLPIGRSRLSRVDVFHDLCGHTHTHRLFELGATTITRSPTCRPWRRYCVSITASVPSRAGSQLRLGDLVPVPRPRRGGAAA